MSCEEHQEISIHNYFDGSLTYDEEIKLKHHLMKCEECQKFFRELKQVQNHLTSIQEVAVPESLKDNVLSNLPKVSRARKFTKTLREHPFITAAAVFFVMMFINSLTQYHNDQLLYLTQHEGVITEGNVVIIPEGEVIEGDFVVKNADIIVKGQIKGNLTLVNSQIINDQPNHTFNTDYYLAHSNIDGNIIEVNRFFSWMAYRFQSGFERFMSFITP